MAGLGEVCSHVGALLFYCEAAARLSASTTCTQQKAKWVLPTINKVDYAEIRHIDFSTPATKKKRIDSAIAGTQLTTRTATKLPNVRIPSEEDIGAFMDKLHNTGVKSVILSVTEKYQDSFIPTILQEGSLPIALITLKEDKYINMDRDSLLAEAPSVFTKLAVTDQQVKNTEELTRPQRKSKEWHALRYGRITASNMKLVISGNCQQPAPSTVAAICEKSHFSSVATDWGKSHEDEAYNDFEKYAKEKHYNFCLSKSGLWINKNYPYIGATPDGILECICCGKGILEIKCPYNARESTLKESQLPFLNEDGTLKITDKYFYQVQNQLLVTETDYGDFVIWTPHEMSIQRITPDPDIFQEIISKAEDYYLKVVLPEVMVNLITREIEEEKNRKHQDKPDVGEVVCHCQKSHVATNTVIKCTSEMCMVKWFHLQCVKLKRIPKAYTCKKCKGKGNAKIKSSKL